MESQRPEKAAGQLLRWQERRVAEHEAQPRAHLGLTALRPPRVLHTSGALEPCDVAAVTEAIRKTRTFDGGQPVDAGAPYAQPERSVARDGGGGVRCLVESSGQGYCSTSAHVAVAARHKEPVCVEIRRIHNSEAELAFAPMWRPLFAQAGKTCVSLADRLLRSGLACRPEDGPVAMLRVVLRAEVLVADERPNDAQVEAELTHALHTADPPLQIDGQRLCSSLLVPSAPKTMLPLPPVWDEEEVIDHGVAETAAEAAAVAAERVAAWIVQISAVSKLEVPNPRPTPWSIREQRAYNASVIRSKAAEGSYSGPSSAL